MGSQVVELPVAALGPTVAVPLLMTIDRGIAELARAGAELAALLAPARPEIAVGLATLGIPVAIEVSRALGLDEYLVLQKTAKIHLGDALAEPVRSVTTGGEQRLLLDRARVHLVAGRRVALVDDVLATGSSIAAALRLLRRAGADVVAVGTLLTEGDEPPPAVAADAALLHALGTVPVFTLDADGRISGRPASGGRRPGGRPG